MANDIATYLKYANLQMAAEALLDKFNNQASTDALKFGNKHSSKFTDVLAADFASKYTVVAHQANTATGFSGTLFKDRQTGELTISFRSTSSSTTLPATTRPQTFWSSEKRGQARLNAIKRD